MSPADFPENLPLQAIPTDHREMEFRPGIIPVWQLKKSLVVEESVGIQSGVKYKRVVVRTPAGAFVPIGDQRPSTFGHSEPPFGVAMTGWLAHDAPRAEIDEKVRELRAALKPMLRELASLYVVAAPVSGSGRLFG